MAFELRQPRPLIALAILTLGGTAQPSLAVNDPPISQQSRK